MYNDRQSKAYGLNASLVYAPNKGLFKGLSMRLQAATNASANKTDEYRPQFEVYNFARTGSNLLMYRDSVIGNPIIINGGDNSRLSLSQDQGQSFRMFLTLTYSRSIGRHDFNIMAGGEESRSKSAGIGYYYSNQQIADQPYFWAFNPLPTANTPSVTRSGKRSFFGNFNYTYAGKYTLEGTARLDASSNFAVPKMWGVFPRVGASWVVSSEPFFKNHAPSFINYARLRANIGITGEDRINANLWRERYKINVGSYLFNEQNLAGLRPEIYPNPNITWEKNRTFNFGADLTLFNNHLTVGFEAFTTKNYDVFDKGNDQNFPMYAGFMARW
ncbi:SusC/RagA family TonB-linked outer membrane protein [Niabella hibiscisoli]|uniref:TonB-dependent receptor n=1 Tax=Niabella hibiscisoli TaxID=1825928 RepID=UPI001F0EA5BA|nr:TonB-dependent receptor [Niabella hibiscisoli]MCH5720275.1 TonB-dependent receptor [Niabella hibiscisoli]